MTDEEIKQSEQTTQSVPSVKVDENKLTTFTYDEKKSIDENASDLMELKASAKALEDEEFVGRVADTKKEQIEESAKANKDIHLAKKEAEKVQAITEIDAAFYEQWKTILKFGGITEPTTKTFAKFMLVLVTPFYVVITLGIVMPITIVRHLFSAINALFEQIATFGKIGRSIAFTTLILGGILLIVWIVYALLVRFGLIQAIF